MKLVSAKCPSCGANLKLSPEDEKTTCEYCHQTILVDDAIATYKLKVSGTVSVEGIRTNKDLIASANELLEMDEFLKAKKVFQEFSEKCPNDYQGWLGLLLCRTRKFSVKDSNIMFQNDIEKYYDHFLKTAPEDVKQEFCSTIENYLHPVEAQNNKKQSNVSFNIDKNLVIAIVMIFFSLAAISSGAIGGIIALACAVVYIPAIMKKINTDQNKLKKIVIAVYFVGIILAFMEI